MNTANQSQGRQDAMKMSTFFLLYIAQSIPMSFFSTVIPVIMRQEQFSLASIGLLQFIKLPWLLKFMWSPAIDRTAHTLNDYKKWIIISEIIYGSLILTVAFLSLKTDFYLILLLIILSFIASATQDIATDALAIRSFPATRRPLLNSMQSMGAFGGTMIGSGILLILYHYRGWNELLPMLACFVLIAIIPLRFYHQTLPKDPARHKRMKGSLILSFFRQKGSVRQILFLFLFYNSLIGILAMSRPYMVDLGYMMKEIGIISGFAGTLTGCVSAFGGGLLLRRIGTERTQIICSLLIVFVSLSFYAQALHLLPLKALPILICLLWGVYGLSSVTLNTTAMQYVRPGCEGTDFTLQTVICHFSGILMAVGYGRIADYTGYSTLFLFSALIGFIALLYIHFIFNNSKDQIAPNSLKQEYPSKSL
ncbi:MAG: MFS transporter [Bacteroidales bacterium]